MGYKYSLCGFRHRKTWLYNDKYGNIILEVNPSYDSLVKRRKRKVLFTQYMKIKYKPILKRIISRDIAEKWIILAKNMLTLIQQQNSELNSKNNMAVFN